jgi:phospholipid/cholesterol/gamma-HCH transport system substrate-binding protein
MKFAIRFADQIVGALIIVALGIVVFVIFMLGSSQRWFSRDYQYKTYFSSATGLSKNMNIQYKGFTIGKVKTFDLSEDDRVEVHFIIFDTYKDRVRFGSLVEILINPIGLGNQFMFYSGTGAEVPEGETIPAVNSSDGKRMLASGQAILPDRDDTINIIMNRVNTVLDTLNGTLMDVQEAFVGTERTALGRAMTDVEMAASGLNVMSQQLPTSLDEMVSGIMSELGPILANLNALTTKLADPQGSVMSVLDAEGDIYTDLLASLDAISGTLRNLERTSEFIPSQLPQVAALISDLHTTLKTAEDVLTSLTNNPLLKRGIPERRETRTGGARPRDLDF